MMPCSDTARNVSQAERRKRAAQRRKTGQQYWSFAGNAGINMWVGVARAGYSIAGRGTDLRRHLAVPAAVAGYLSWTFVPRLTLAIWSILGL